MARLEVIVVCASIFTAVSGSHMQGGTISFKATEKTHTGWTVDFKYKSSFINGYGGQFYWGCFAGDCGYEINHWIQPVENRTSYPSSWYQYEGHVRRRVDNDKPFQLWESSCCWVPNTYYEGGWQLITSVDLGIRSDTQMPNTSPVTTIIPIIRIPQNCETTINLLGHDPDGDLVSCRHGYYYGECSFCSWNFYVDHKQCTLSTSSRMSTGSYVVELILEDFPKNDIYLTYNDGTTIYKYRPFNRRRRELPKDSQKYYWYDTTKADTQSSSAVTMETTAGSITTSVSTTEADTQSSRAVTMETSAGSIPTSDSTTEADKTFQRTSLSTTDSSTDTQSSSAVTMEATEESIPTSVSTTEAAAEISTETIVKFTTHHDYTTEETTTDETSMEPLTDRQPSSPPDIKTTPDYYTTAEPSSPPDTKTTPDYYTTAEPSSPSDTKTTPDYYTTAEPSSPPDIKTTPDYYITEAVTDLPRRTTLAFEQTTQHILTEAVSFPYETTGWDFYPTSDLPVSVDSLSKISLQFIVEVTSNAPSCALGDYRPKFISPTPRQGEKLLTNVGSVFQLHLSAQAAYETVSDFKVSGPPGITKTLTSKSRSTTKSMVIGWIPSENNLRDHVPFCFIAETFNGYQSEMRCVIVVVGPSNLDNIQLLCYENTMTLIAAKSSDHELYENQFRLNDPQCLVSSNSTHLIASVAYNSCGTQTEETEHDIVFKNQATSFSNKSSVITRKHGVSIPFNCSFPKKSRVSASFRAHKSDYVFTEAGFGNFTYKFQFYTDDRFIEVETQYPLEVTLQELLYMEIQVSSSVPNIQLFVESCKATPHDNPNDPTFYNIIQNGCIKDETLVVYSTSRTKYRFGMEAFAFIGDYSEVYMSCTVVLCKFKDPGTRCSQGCIRTSLGDPNRQRNRRSLTSESQQHFISQGPLTMKRQSLRTADHGESPSLNMNTLVISLSGVVIVALLGFIVHIYRKRVRLSGYELLKTENF